jgi:tetratricopeptide (TPR) repeat protein
MSDASLPIRVPAVSKAADWKWGILLFCVAVIPFLPAIRGEYVWDDDVWVVNNASVHAWNGLWQIWNPAHFQLDFYPITFSLLWLEHKFWNLNPLGYHLVNILCHAGGTLFLWLCLRRLGFRWAWFGALCWAVHPVQVESVAWIAEIKNCLSGFFYFFAAWCYLRFEGVGEVRGTLGGSKDASERRWGFYAAAVFLFVLSLLSKSVTVTLPASLLLVLWCGERRSAGGFLRKIMPLLPLVAVGVALASFRAHQEHLAMEIGGARNLVFSAPERLIIAGKDIWFYLRTLVVPYPLMAIYPRWTYDPANAVNYVPAGAAIAVGIVLFLLRRRITRWPLGAWLFFVITLSPALGFVNFTTMRFTFVADHYQYLAFVGIVLLVSESLGNALRNHSSPRRFLVLACLSAEVGLSLFYASLFQTNMKLWSWNVAHNPNAFAAQHNLGAAYMSAGQPEEGMRHIEIALHEAPDDSEIQLTVGEMALQANHYDEAIDHLLKAVALRPEYGKSYVLLGHVYDRMGRLNDAVEAYSRAVGVRSAFPGAYVDYAADLKKAGRVQEADHAYEVAIAIDPGNLITHYNYGNLLLDMDRIPEAIAQYQFILQYQSNNALVWHNLAVAYYQAHQMDQAMAAKQRADALDAAMTPTVPGTKPGPVR